MDREFYGSQEADEENEGWCDQCQGKGVIPRADCPECLEQRKYYDRMWCEHGLGGVWTDGGCESKTNEGVEERRLS